MATEIKKLSYFPLDTQFFENEKIEMLMANFGFEASGVYIKLLCKIYTNGYYMRWNETICKVFTYSLHSRFNSKKVQQIIDFLVEFNFFNKKLFLEHQILTSKGIQERFFEIISRRKNFVCENVEYLLVPIPKRFSESKNGSKMQQSSPLNDEKCNISGDSTGENVDISKQSKVKESIVKESKVKILNERESARAHEENSSENSSNNENRVSAEPMQPIDKLNAIEAKMYGKSKYENWRQEMLKDNDWLSHVCRSSGKGTRAMDKLELVMNMFESHIISVGEEHTLEKINDYKRRFIYWWRSEKFAPYESLVNRSSENIGKSGRRNGIEYNEETLAELRRMNLEVQREREEQERRKREKEQNYAIR
ncbi:MAG: DUF4373 domain-containing protein [Parabacteroides sp.]|nr:DUF4373 domain-containing protein [Parabacteroides sp.]